MQELEAKPQNTAIGLPSGLVMLSYLSYTTKSMCIRMVLPTVGWVLLYQIAINEMSPQTYSQASPNGGNSSVKVYFFPVCHIAKEISYHRIYLNHLISMKGVAVKKIKWYIKTS